MKLLCLIDNLGSGGAQRQLVNLAILWKRKGHEVIFTCYGDANFYEPQLEENEININRIKNKNILDRIIKIRKFIRKCNPDIVISFLLTPNLLACISSIGKHKWKLITSELSANEKSFLGLRSKIYKWFERYSDWTVCNSYNAQQMWERYYPQFVHRISTIYNPVIMPQTQTNTEKRQDGRRRIVVAASYQGLKNPINVIEAVNKLSEAQQKRLIIDWYGRKEVTTGNVEIAEQAERLVAQYGLDACVHLNEATHEIYKEMCNADAVGLFSLYEGLPNAVCEGMMLGKPILMTRMSDYARLVTKDNGFLCDAEDVQSIKGALVAFLQASDETLESMGRSSRERAMELFAADRIVEQWEALFEKLVSGKDGEMKNAD